MNKLFSILIILIAGGTSMAKTQDLFLVPQPQQVTLAGGKFELKKNQSIGYEHSSLQPAAEYLQHLLSVPSGMNFAIKDGDGTINLSIDEQLPLGKSGYKLTVSKEKINLVAKDYQGIICGISTLRQMLPKEIEMQEKVKGVWRIPCAEISDAPAYEWRGLHLDVSRHFYSVAEVEELLDLMCLYKLNKFHWHLTDDQGWRIEIKRYPLLTEKGGWRKFNDQDKVCLNRAREEGNPDFLLPEEKIRIEKGDMLYGGFYTQEDIREVVRYAAQRGIDVIPEIDMPGHILCAMQNYEGISCFAQTGWGSVFSSPVCPGKESALEFCKNVYAEVCSLFPYQYIHLGADEVEKTNWKKCPDCQMRIKALGLKNEEELQAWFVKYMEMFLNSHNKRLLGWDEIVEGGLSKSATITWWRGWAPESVAHALNQGNEVILCPTSYCYFDYQPDNSTLESIYKGEFYNRPITKEQQKLIKGIQANIWTEWIPTRARMQYMIFPRAMAIAERAWTDRSHLDWNSFNLRVAGQIDRLYGKGVNYFSQGLENFMPLNVFTDRCNVDFVCRDRYTQIRYTTDGTEPTLKSRLYTKPIRISQSTNFKVRLFNTKGKPVASYAISYVKQDYSPATEPAAAKNGIKIDWYDYNGERCDEVVKSKLNRTFIEESIGIPQEAKGNIGLNIQGYIEVPADDVYTFGLLSDDGSDLRIDDNLVIDNDGPHSPREVKGQMALRKGKHKVAVRYFDHNGGILKFTIKNSRNEEVKVRFYH